MSFIVGSHGLGRQNHRGQMLIDFCERNGLTVTNTWFKRPKRRLYTRKAPGDWSQHQLDYILVKHQFRNSVKDVLTLPGRYWLWPQLIGCQVPHQVEENYKIPKEQT